MNSARNIDMPGLFPDFRGLAGVWEGEIQVWDNRRGNAPRLKSRSSVRGKIRPLSGDYFLIHEYSGIMDGEPFKGMSIYGYNHATGRFQSACIEGFHRPSEIQYTQGWLVEHIYVAMGYCQANTANNELLTLKAQIEVIDYNRIVISDDEVGASGHTAPLTRINYQRIHNTSIW